MNKWFTITKLSKTEYLYYTNWEKDNYGFYLNSIPDIPNDAGCYAIYLWDLIDGKMRLKYIGTASNIKRRLYCHDIKNTLTEYIQTKNLLFTKIMIKVRVLNNKTQREKLEKYLINKLTPPLNKK